MSTPAKYPFLIYFLFNILPRAKVKYPPIKPKAHTIYLPRPSAEDSDAWHDYWTALGQPWRMEPEIDWRRQEEFEQRRAIIPDIEKGIYPFKGIKLSRADIEWLLATHENGSGPVDWNYESQRQRKGLDLRGTNLRGADLRYLPLACLRGGLARGEWYKANEEQRNMAAIILEGANLMWSHLEGSDLRKAHLENVDLEGARLERSHLRQAHLEGSHLEKAHLEETNLRYAHLEGTDLRGAYLDGADLHNASVGDDKHIGPRIADAKWGNINHAAVGWSRVYMLNDEYVARQKKRDGKMKDSATLQQEHEAASRANRQLAVVLQEQGLYEHAIRFAYRAQTLQRRVWWFHMFQRGSKPKLRLQAFGAWLFSWFLFLLAGYGYKLWRSFLAYALVIIGFTMAYCLLGDSFKPSLSLVNALGLSMTSFHGRGFFPGVTQLDDTLTILASIEAFVGLILEAAFIATLTQRFFGK